ncbi:nectin-2 isoform X1 [Dromiciops gliroides]|uniref:nectin-2 isoform X1 n=1 Tax=Dromiciops gliroides TaxID=33562 RepID=UPI001CC649AD|nr:nectin-2 isoform X1 [Dromiciops gliroides]
MARPTALPLLLLLFLGTGAENVQVQVQAEVRGLLGNEVKLPCHLLSGKEKKIRVSQAMWLRWDRDGGSQSVAVFHPQHGASFPNSNPYDQRMSFAIRNFTKTEAELRDATLLLKGLRAEDEANYTCEFATFPWGSSKGATWLRVLAEPQNHAESQEVILAPDPKPMARCVSSGGRPPARISWFSPLPGEGTETKTAGPLPGTFTVTSRFTLVPIPQANGAKVTCKVEHETFSEPVLIPLTLSVKYPPEVSISGYDDNWFVGRVEASLSCDVQSNPEPTSYKWSTITGSLPTTAVAQGPRLIIRTVDEAANTTFVCSVVNAVGTGRAEQTIRVRESPDTAGAGATGGIIGGIIAAIIALAVAATAILICRQQQKEEELRGRPDEEEDELEGPPAYKPPPPKMKLEEPEMPSQLFTLGSSEHIPLKTPYFEPSLVAPEQDMPRYHELPTLEERASAMPSNLEEPGAAAGEERLSLEDKDDYLDKINPIYDALAYTTAEAYQVKGFVMSRAMYV